MPRKISKLNCPHSEDKGFITGRPCKTIDGHLILIDTKKTELGIKSDDQWVIIHVPTYTAIALPTVRKARAELLSLAAKGGAWIDEIKATLTKKAKKKAPKKKSVKAKKKVAKPVLAPTGAGESKPESVKSGDFELVSIDPQGINNALVGSLESNFPNQAIIDCLTEMLNASRTWTKKGRHGEEEQVIVEPDWMARDKALDKILKWKIGLPVQRMEVKNTNEMSWDDVREMAMNSPNFYKGLKELVEEIELTKKNNKPKRKRK